ncbi:hypothetical protein [Blastococcus tunisiensis]|uniref:Uncharacterized protein n=1 Tax=Blastococcus tunisiensis TaxID=1798228 RepID=A0A1I2J8F3_9ACTN|nr:hypothetical protein [Blastococcus sp. DSM 46838]SFF50270.1 hypothetical protein SAMN05216574_11558 [Blastococcus sp. DSM 46838]
MTTAPPLPSTRATPATQQQRRLRYGAALAALRARDAVLPPGSVQRRQALQVCGAANLLTALGVRVDVVQPAVPWPRHRRHWLLVDNSAGLLGDLALLVGAPRTAEGWAETADRVLPVRSRARRPAPAGEAVVCPVTVRYRTDDGPVLAPPRSLYEVMGFRGLVVEVRLLAVGREVRRAA